MLQEKRFTIKDSEASYRLMNHWTELGLVEDSIVNEEGWRRLSLVDLIWIKALMEMRRFGMPLNALKTVKDSVFKAIKKGVTRPDFEYAIAHGVLVKKTTFFLLVFSDGGAEVLDQEQIDFNRGLGLLSEQSYLTLNINALCKQIIPSLSIPLPFFAPYLDEKELSVIEAIREGRHDEIEVRLRDGSVERIA